MKIISNILYIEFAEMVACGVSEGYLKKAKSIGTSCWNFINDNEDRRKVLVQFDTLKPQYQQMVIAKYGNPHEYYASTGIKKHIQPDHEARRFYMGEGLPQNHIDSYTLAAEWLNFMLPFTIAGSKAALKNTLGLDKETFWKLAISLIEKDGVKLPTSYSRLTRKIAEYRTDGYKCLVSKKFGNDNSQKITEEAEDWLLAQFALPIKKTVTQLWCEYNTICNQVGWKELKSEETIRLMLYTPANEQKWYGARHGYTKYANQRFSYMLKTELPTFRDALWVSDGTKLNFFDREGKLKAAWTIYEVMDVYSEAFLGYHISKSEDHVTQYMALKQAVKVGMARPYELKFDNQGGHRKLMKMDFIEKLSRLAITSRPHNPQSKTIESAFGRFQQQYMRKFWFFTGQNITAKKTDSRANIEFILENMRNLPTTEEVFAAYAQARDEWNNALHHKYNKPRMELYLSSQNPFHQAIDYLDMVDIFWLTKEKPITYYNTGITVTVNKEEYEYEVLTDGMPDVGFRRQWLNEQFVVRFDPEDMSHIRLYLPTTEGLKYIANASPRLCVPRAIIDRKEGDHQLIADLLKVKTDDQKHMKQQNSEREQRTGVKRADLVEVLTSVKSNKTISLAGVLKEESYYDNEDADPLDLM